MVDYYGYPSGAPGFELPEAPGNQRQPQIVEALKGHYSDPRFHPLVVLHEIESLVLSAIRAGGGRGLLSEKTIEAYSLSGEKANLTPREADFKNHRSYQYQDLTTRGTVEFRSVCTQPFDKTFASAAFHLGILENLENVKAYLQDASFFQEEGRDYKALRRKFSKKELTASEIEHIYEFTKTLLQLARAGLLVRQLGEEAYLPSL